MESIQEAGITLHKLAEKGNFEELIIESKKVAQQYPKWFGVWYYLGIAHGFKEEHALAEKFLLTCISLKPNFFEALVSLGASCEAQGRRDDAVLHLEEALIIEPNSELVLKKLGVKYFLLENYNKSAECFQRLTELNPENDENWYCLGDAYRQKDLFAEAIKAYFNALNIDNENYLVIHNIGVCYWYLEDYETAATFFKKVIEFIPDSFRALRNLGECYLKMSDKEKAKEYFFKALHCVPDDEHVKILLGQAIS
ncbi:MAG: tetratricopeptide repeat protein [Bacteroidales bacterium]|nr:tetratricopeptide repeat protein [Bacteroidales bacterium]